MVLAPLALASVVLRVSINTALTRSVWPEEVGGALGLSAALSSFTRMIALSIGGFLLGWVGTPAPGVVGALLMLWTIYYVWKRVLFPEQLSDPDSRFVEVNGITLWEVTRASHPLGLEQRLGEVRTPVLVITGDDDRIVPAEQSVRLAEELPRAELVVIPNCATFPRRSVRRSLCGR